MGLLQKSVNHRIRATATAILCKGSLDTVRDPHYTQQLAMFVYLWIWICIHCMLHLINLFIFFSFLCATSLFLKIYNFSNQFSRIYDSIVNSKQVLTNQYVLYELVYVPLTKFCRISMISSRWFFIWWRSRE